MSWAAGSESYSKSGRSGCRARFRCNHVMQLVVRPAIQSQVIFSSQFNLPTVATVRMASGGESITESRFAPTLLERRKESSSDQTKVGNCCKGTGFGSPLEAKNAGVVEELLYIPAVQMEKGLKPDYLATVDVNPNSPSYCQVIHRLHMAEPGDELHHLGWNACSSCRGQVGRPTHSFIIAPGVLSGNIHIIDVRSDPRAPKLHKTIPGAEILAKTGAALPHTAHCAPDEIIMSFMGSGTVKQGFEPHGAGFVCFDPKTFEIKQRWEAPENPTRFGYDFWYQPRHNVMVSSEWGDPACFTKGFNPAHVAEGRYGSKLYIWDWTDRTLKQELDVGAGFIPLEVRFLHDPDKAEGYTGCALSSEMVRFRKTEEGQWEAKTVIKVDSIPVEGWALPEMPGLITDFLISMDDRFIFLSNWLHGDVRQYDITGEEPKLVGQFFVGGSMKRGGTVTRTDGESQPEPLVVKGVEVQGARLPKSGYGLVVTRSDSSQPKLLKT